jgi:hypothetical protein
LPYQTKWLSSLGQSSAGSIGIEDSPMLAS